VRVVGCYYCEACYGGREAGCWVLVAVKTRGRRRERDAGYYQSTGERERDFLLGFVCGAEDLTGCIYI